jgi:probable rRNA maturation factor
LNKKYRKNDKSTDVLSFGLMEGKILDCPDKNIPLGDIVLSVDTARKQAVNAGHPLTKEIVFLFIHGLLHLIGYEDPTQKKLDIMISIQNEIMKKIFN